MSAVAYTDTVPAHPLGIPVDGRARYGMTPEMAFAYGWLVKNRPPDSGFRINFSQLGATLVIKRHHAFKLVVSLMERGWIDQIAHGEYCFVHPVMCFRELRNG